MVTYYSPFINGSRSVSTFENRFMLNELLLSVGFKVSTGFPHYWENMKKIGNMNFGSSVYRLFSLKSRI